MACDDADDLTEAQGVTQDSAGCCISGDIDIEQQLVQQAAAAVPASSCRDQHVQLGVECMLGCNEAAQTVSKTVCLSVMPSLRAPASQSIFHGC